MRIAMLHSRIRVEERLLLDALAERGVEPQVIDLREELFDVHDAERWSGFDVVFDRSLSLTVSLTAVRALERFGLRCVNTGLAIEVCSDKHRTSLALARAGVPTPRTVVAASAEAALEAVERIGYPAVLKPTVGSWGRLLARINDRDAAEAVIEHRATLGSASQGVFYVQEHIDKPGRDLRVFVVGGEPIAAIARASEHWVTNTARGAKASGLAIDDGLASLSRRAAACVHADLCAIDLLECPERGLLVSEVNHSMEFRNSIETTGVDIPGRMADHLLRIAAACAPARLAARVRDPLEPAGILA